MTKNVSDHRRSLPRARAEWRIAIVHALFHEAEVQAMVEYAKRTLIDAGVSENAITLHPVAGSFEVPLIGAAIAEAKGADALIGFGVIVEGETHHASLLAEQTARGIMDVQIRYRIPFAFEILYVADLNQARARAEKGREAAVSVLRSLHTLQDL
ncbi:MAG: 6,7-dimethyl-8-ribityllumazine synthase [Candidatus Peregrinibacteria bacterium]|nr:6,7-dimethyl-8-ribityllumazine synthase [Candidatus Peregrinibacteria bacterium]